MTIHEKHLEWLEARGIPASVAEAHGLHTHNDGHGLWLRVPFNQDGETINHKWRQISHKKHRMDKDAPLLLWNHQALVEAAATGGVLAIFEGEWDALAAITLGHSLSVSVPNGAPKEADENPWDAKRYEWFQRHRAELDLVRKFVLATDGDEPGRALAADLARLLGVERCEFITYPDDCKDFNEVLLKHGEAAALELLATAKPYPVVGLYRLEDFPELPEFRTVDHGIPRLNQMLPLVTGTFTVITGFAGHGKSSLVFSMIANLLKAGVPMAIGSFETLPKPILQRSLRACYYGCSEADERARKPGSADVCMANQLSIISTLGANDETELTIEYILELARVAVLRDGIRLLILDPWNEIEHKRGRDETETDYVGRAIRLIKRFGKDYDCAVWLVAHPRKPTTDGNPKPPSLYDLAGSANFANKADYGLTVHREDLSDTVVDARVVKVRKGLPGWVGKVSLMWREETSRYDLVS